MILTMGIGKDRRPKIGVEILQFLVPEAKADIREEWSLPPPNQFAPPTPPR